MYVGDCNFKGKQIDISRDKHGKFFVTVDGQRTGPKLNASEMCRWFLQAMHEEENKITDEMLRKQCDEFLKSGKRIQAIAHYRKHREAGLKEGLDYIKQSKFY